MTSCAYIERTFSDGYWKCCLSADPHLDHWLVWVRTDGAGEIARRLDDQNS